MSRNYSIELNNYLQKNNLSHAISWLNEQCGGGNAEWTVTCKINGEVKGVGKSSKKNAAKDYAAKQTLRSLGVQVD
ncbi:hypothetical protein BKA93DRAFT_767110 [Sparassis latifolia]